MEMTGKRIADAVRTHITNGRTEEEAVWNVAGALRFSPDRVRAIYERDEAKETNQ